MSARWVHADVVPLRDDSGELTGRARARGHFHDRVEWVAPRRESVAEAELDVKRLHEHGVTKFRVVMLRRSFSVWAADAESACEIAHQQWGEWPGEATS